MASRSKVCARMMRQLTLSSTSQGQSSIHTSNNINMPSLGYPCILSVHTSMHSWISSLCFSMHSHSLLNFAFCWIHFCLAYQAKMSLTLQKSEVDERWSRLILVQPLSTLVHSCSLCVASFPGLPRFYLLFAFRREGGME